MSKNGSYDLEERTAKFGELVIDFCKSLKINSINSPLISQLIRSATSIGANYMEANAASSKRDFGNKIYICRKESQETKHWLRMIAKSNTSEIEIIRKIWRECQQLTLIFSKITRSIKKK